MTMSDVRQDALRRLREDLEGPRGGPVEFLPDTCPPTDMYSLGILYPRVESDIGDPDDSGAVDEDLGTRVAAEKEEADDSPLAPMLQKRPASAGMTFALEHGTACKLAIACAAYEAEIENDMKGWRRRAVAVTRVEIDHARADGLDDAEILEGLARLRVRWRKLGTCDVVTVSVVSATPPVAKDHKPRPDECLFQLSLSVECEKGKFRPPPAPSFVVDDEEAELRLRYQHNKAWATGHGCSVRWEADRESSPAQVSIEFLPVAFVSRFIPDQRPDAQFDPAALSLERLAKVEDASDLKDLLDPFVADFAAWLEGLAGTDDEGHEDAFRRVIARLSEQLDRLRNGIAFLAGGDEDVLEAFRIGNTAILDQMERLAAMRGRPFKRSDARWRPFQLAFMLLAAPGSVRDDPGDSRGVVDLIWFPTGGGKTEAYLLLMAFVISHRRLVDPVAGGGTAVISRYTLRLLTQDQFTRTATLICCLERLRRIGRISGEEISIGLWIGGGQGQAPNKFKDALTSGRKVYTQEVPANPFMLDRCPMCGHLIVPDRISDRTEDYGFRATASSFHLFCPRPDCDFHSGLPIQVVDEALYENPPTVLLGTIDKFARLAWDGRCRSFFGLDQGDGSRQPPSLVIQDELHLISGPLGTIAAIYEAAMDTLFEHAGQRPKYVAATATIRNAGEQATKLYGRKAAVFPAPGIDSSDSYYMREDPDQTRARAYVGYMGQGHTPVTASVHVLASSLLAGQVCTEGDKFWTLVAYHNSRRELGKTMTLARDDVPLRIELLAGDEQERRCDEVFELSSNVPTRALPGVLHKMASPRESGEAIDLVACTNMISVGVDVPRLNLMVVMGQPKTASEYIQASSRVGRANDAAGLVIVNFAGTKPRDRAHYESFLVFHEGFYRWVEPSSVTPESPRALDRALHASVIAAVRLAELPKDVTASGFDPEKFGAQDAILDTLRSRIRSRVPAESWSYVESRFDSIVKWWADAASEHRSLRYHAKSGSQFKSLLERFGEDRGRPAMKTLDSMRNVEGSARFKVKGATFGAES